MTPPLFLLAVLPEDDELLLGGDEGRHATRVRRLERGEAVLVSDGRGGVLECRVRAVAPDGLTLDVTARRTVPVPDPRLVAVQALPKGDRAELAVETMTELGVDEIVPWQASRSITQWRGVRGEKALARWRSTAREAAKQSRRPWIPIVRDPQATAGVAALVRDCAAALVLDADAAQPLAEVDLPATGDIAIVVGPEGGIDGAELDAFTAAGAHPVRLGAPVLRTSTAGAAALAALSLRAGRWS